MRTNDVNAYKIIPALFQPLVSIREGKIHPGAALRWEEIPSGLRFHLDPEATWSDGSSVTSEDFARSLNWVLDITNASPCYSLFHGLVKKVKTPQPLVLEILFSRSAPYLLSLAGVWWPWHRDDPTGSRFPRRTNGEMTIESWDRDRLVLVRRGRSPTYADRVMVMFIADEMAALNQFEAGGIHVMESPPYLDVQRALKANPKVVQIFPLRRTYYLALNPRSPVLADLNVRRLIFSQLDRKALARLREPFWNAANYWVPDEFMPQPLPPKLEDVLHRAAPARKPAHLELLTSNVSAHRVIAEWLEQQFAHMGVSLSIWSQESKVFLQTRHRKETQAFLGSWNGSHEHAHTFLEIFLPNGPLHFLVKGRKDFGEWVLRESPADIRAAARWLSWDGAVLLPLTTERAAFLANPSIGRLDVSPYGFLHMGHLGRMQP
jgi:ABC-type transport system substrate-binding protein